MPSVLAKLGYKISHCGIMRARSGVRSSYFFKGMVFVLCVKNNNNE